MSEDIITRLKDNVIEGRIKTDDEGVYGDLAGTPGVVDLTKQAIDSKISLESIINDGLSAGMKIVGEKFASKEYFIPDMLASAEAVGAAMDIIKPLLEASDIKTKGTFVIATVKGDLHDIGKNIVAIMVKGAGYNVVDMGIDVPTEKIVEIIKEEKPEFLGLSALLTTTMLEMDAVIKALKEINRGTTTELSEYIEQPRETVRTILNREKKTFVKIESSNEWGLLSKTVTITP